MLEFDVHGCTDVTGFGLIGHAREMALGERRDARDRGGCSALFAGRAGICTAGAVPGGLKNNREFASLRG